MYPNILLSALILLLALRTIGRMVSSSRLTRAASVCIVLLFAAALIAWLLLGMSPVPKWLTRFLLNIFHTAAAGVAALGKSK